MSIVLLDGDEREVAIGGQREGEICFLGSVCLEVKRFP